MFNKMSRRSFIKGAAASAMGIAALGLVQPMTTAKAEEGVAQEVTVKAKVGKVDGKYVTRAVGHESFIYVATTIYEGKITACQVLSHEETMGIGNFACARIPAAIVANQSINVPNVRGCSITSMAIKNAVKDAIEQAGYDPANFSAEVKKFDVVEREETAEADVVIVGAGTVGLVAGARLLEKGKKVVLIEKRDIPGGSGPMAYGGVAIAGCEMYDNYDVTGALKNSYYGSVENMMGFWRTHPFLNPEYDRFDKAMPYMTAQYSNIGHLVDWFVKIGLGFNPIGTYEGGLTTGYTPYLAPGCYEGGAGYAMMFLEQRIKGLGGTILYSTEATELITADGKVTGVKAKSEDGASWTVNGKAVLLASGGFMRNADMIKEYYPEYAGQFFNCASASTGDGIKMGLAVGGYMECTGRALPAYLSTYASKFEIALIHHSTPGIMVNAFGDNIGNIVSDNHYKMAAAKLALESTHGGALYYVFDDASACTNSDFEGYGMNTYKAIFEKGEAVKYASLEEAAEKLGLTNLKATVETNNAHSLAGEADEWGRKGLPYIETREGVWVMRVDPTFYLTTGGLAIDTETHVLKEDGSIISGLYAGGDVCGSIEEKDGKKYGMGFDAALAYGYIAGEVIAKELA